MASNLPSQMLLESFITVVYTLALEILFRGLFLDQTCSISTGWPLVGYSYLLRTDGLVCKDVNGLCFKLHCCTPGLVRTSAESAPDKGTTSAIPIEPLMLLLLLLLVPCMYLLFAMHV
jgi:hypothetical protein